MTKLEGSPDFQFKMACLVTGVFILLATLAVFAVFAVFDGDKHSGWRISTKQDPFTDKVEAEASLSANDDESALHLRCTTGTPVVGTVFIDDFGNRIGETTRAGPSKFVEIPVTYRFDSGPVIHQIITGLQTHSVVDLDEPFVGQLVASEKLAFRMRTKTAIFDTAAPREVIEELRTRCK